MSCFRILITACTCVALGGCALFSKGDVPMRRYFSPDMPSTGAPARAPPGLELRLNRVTSGMSITEHMMFRESAHEVGFYDDRLWTEKPELYLRRGLTRVLFEEQGLRSVVRGAGPTLDVELISFEEVKAPTHVARVKIAFSLSDERIVSLQQTLTIERPIGGSKPETEASDVAEALGKALRDAIDEVSGRVLTSLTTTALAHPVAASP